MENDEYTNVNENDLTLSAEGLETARKWAEVESNFLNQWMNRRLWRRWEEHLQDTSQRKELS